MQTVTKFIVALCPAHPIYLGCPSLLPIAYANTKDLPAYPEYGLVTTDRAKAMVFDTFEEAQTASQSFKGWGGAQRVEQIAVDPTDAARAELRTALRNRIEARIGDLEMFSTDEGSLTAEDCRVEYIRVYGMIEALHDIGGDTDTLYHRNKAALDRALENF